MPLDTQPNYYLIRVDSTWSDSNDGGPMLIYEHIDEILEAIRAQCGSANPGRHKNGSGKGAPPSWPPLPYSSGISWFGPSDLTEVQDLAHPLFLPPASLCPRPSRPGNV